MLKKLAISAVAALALSGGAALAAGASGHVEDVDFSFEGPFGKFDQNQLQRGLKVYTEVCSACHGLKYVPLRTLADPGGPGFTEDQVRAYAADNFSVYDPEIDDDRAARPADHFPANNGVGAPDLSLVAKSRAGFHGPYGTGMNQLFKGMGGPEYIYSLLTGYTGEEKEEAGTVFYGNTAFPGGWISMGPPLADEQVEFDDGHDNSLHHMSQDVAAFLMWAAEPKMMARKQAGFVAVLFLVLLTSLLYLTNKRLWAPVKKGAKAA
ncbi:MAG: cytochrome c1 [Rhodobacteraceae bacterium]|jgi:ubiquinol-cytochrome c reductase cytochrome c1 subunit|nr:cytochrome c1 [Paracoccaceae bacterium]NBV61594.1 cytochrome c1 [Paracoccaceae bacterium]